MLFIFGTKLAFVVDIEKSTRKTTMKKIAITLMIALLGISGFGQVIQKPSKGRVVTLKHLNAQRPKPQPAVVDFSNNTEKVNVVYGRIDENGDTTLLVILPEVDINLMQRYRQIIDSRKGQRLANNVRTVYPFAKAAGQKMKEYDSILMGVSDKSLRHKMMKEAEDEITAQYTEDLKNLTFTQGAILIRLIDRETGNTSYKVVQELRGKVRAFFYQGFARLWGYNLKTEFDPHNNPEDDDIDTIVTLLDLGMI